jgi:hypothetical protein
MSKKKESDYFNPNPPLSNTLMRFMLIRNKENNNITMTSGGEYRSDWYELLFESNDEDEVRNVYMKMIYDAKKPF